MKDISFIIPVYDTSIPVLSRCLDSIKNQNNLNYEIIIINDGSKNVDNEEYTNLAFKYDAKYCYQDKQGVSSARNRGIIEATGKYISFVDSDDKLINNAFSKSDVEKNCDFLIYNVIKTDQRSKEKKLYNLSIDGNLTEKKMIINFLSNDMLNWSVGKLYKRDFLIKNNIFFDKNRISGEDFVFVYTVFKHEPMIKYISKPVYEYIYSDITGKKRILSDPVGNINDIMTLYKIRLKILEQYKDLNDYYSVNLCQNTINDLFNNYYILVEQNKDVVEKLHFNYIKAINNLDKNALAKIKLKYKIKMYFIIHKTYVLTKIYNNLFVLKNIMKR